MGIIKTLLAPVRFTLKKIAVIGVITYTVGSMVIGGIKTAKDLALAPFSTEKDLTELFIENTLETAAVPFTAITSGIGSLTNDVIDASTPRIEVTTPKGEHGKALDAWKDALGITDTVETRRRPARRDNHRRPPEQ